MQFYGAKELMIILGVSRSKSYYIIRTLAENLHDQGKMCPKPGKIQKTFFCDSFILDPDECDNILEQHEQHEQTYISAD